MPYSIIVTALRPRTVPSNPNSPTEAVTSGWAAAEPEGAHSHSHPHSPSTDRARPRTAGTGPSQPGSASSPGGAAGRERKDESPNLLQVTDPRAPERPRADLRHGFAHRLGLRRYEVSERIAPDPRASPQRGAASEGSPGRLSCPALPDGRGSGGWAETGRWRRNSPLSAASRRRWGAKATGGTSTRKTSLASSTSCWTATTTGSGRDLEVEGETPAPSGRWGSASAPGHRAAPGLAEGRGPDTAGWWRGGEEVEMKTGMRNKVPVPRQPAASCSGPGPAPLRAQLVSVSRRCRDRSQNGHLRDQLWAGVRRGDGKGPARCPCSPFPGFITVASELSVIRADYEL